MAAAVEDVQPLQVCVVLEGLAAGRRVRTTELMAVVVVVVVKPRLQLPATAAMAS